MIYFRISEIERKDRGVAMKNFVTQQRILRCFHDIYIISNLVFKTLTFVVVQTGEYCFSETILIL